LKTGSWPFGVGHASWALGFLALSEGALETAAAILDPVVGAAEAVGVH